VIPEVPPRAGAAPHSIQGASVPVEHDARRIVLSEFSRESGPLEANGSQHVLGRQFIPQAEAPDRASRGRTGEGDILDLASKP
jgi:hypothetical protein